MGWPASKRLSVVELQTIKQVTQAPEGHASHEVNLNSL